MSQMYYVASKLKRFACDYYIWSWYIMVKQRQTLFSMKRLIKYMDTHPIFFPVWIQTVVYCFNNTASARRCRCRNQYQPSIKSNMRGCVPENKVQWGVAVKKEKSSSYYFKVGRVTPNIHILIEQCQHFHRNVFLQGVLFFVLTI